MDDFLREYLHVGPLLMLSGLILVLNLVMVLMRRSGIPLIGAGIGVAACMMHPSLRPYAWLPLVLDLGTLKLLYELPEAVRRERRFANRIRLAEFQFADADRKINLDLFDNGACRLQFEIEQPADSRAGPLFGRWKISGGKQGRTLSLEMSEGGKGRYAFSVAGDPAELTCTAEKHPLAKQIAAASLAGCRLQLIAGNLPKNNPSA